MGNECLKVTLFKENTTEEFSCEQKLFSQIGYSASIELMLKQNK